MNSYAGGQEMFRRQAVIPGTRIPVRVVFDLLADGHSIDELVRELPEVSREELQAVLMQASRLLAASAMTELEG